MTLEGLDILSQSNLVGQRVQCSRLMIAIAKARRVSSVHEEERTVITGLRFIRL